MKEKLMFADVSLPFHVWVKEGHRWVLRDAAGGLDAAPTPQQAIPTSQGSSEESPRLRR
jgi:hypothetical protein